MTSLTADLTTDDCLSLLHKLYSDDAEAILAAIEWLNNRPGSFDEITTRANEVSEKPYKNFDFREAISKLSKFERDDINRKVLELLDSDDSTIRYWTALTLSDKYFTMTVPVLLKYFGSADSHICSDAISKICHDADSFNGLSEETRNQILSEMQKVLLTRYDKDFGKDVLAHTIYDALYSAIFSLAQLLPSERLVELYDRLVEMSSSPHVYIRVEAAKGLKDVATRIRTENSPMYESIESILKQMFNDSDNTVRHEALWGLAQANSEHALDAAIKATEDTDLVLQLDGVGVMRLHYAFTPKALRTLRRITPIWLVRQPSYLKDEIKLTKFQKFLSYLPF